MNDEGVGDAPEQHAERTPGFVVRHLTGSRRGTEERIAGASAGIGRGRTNRIALDPELDRTVSARHAEIRCEEGLLVLYDLGSLNGTYVNGRRVRRSELADGDEIGLGREGPRLLVRRDGPGATEAGAPPLPAPAAADDAVRGIPDRGRSTVPPPAGRRSPLVVAALIGGVLLVAAVGAWFVVSLLARVKKLEGGRSGATAVAPAVAPSSLLVVRGVALDENGRVTSTAELGAAIYVRRRTAATSDAVLREIRRFLAGRPSARIEVSPEGLPAVVVAVVGRRGDASAEAPAAVVLLETAQDLAAPQAIFGSGAPPQKLSLRRPEFPAEDARLEEALGMGGMRAADPASAPLLRVSTTGTTAGAGLFDATGALRGLAAGPAMPGLFLSVAALAVACELLETTSASPLL